MNGIKEVTPTSWEMLNTELFADSWQPDIRRHRSSWAFRGVSRASYDLSSTLQRLGHKGSKQDMIEEALKRNFRKYAHSRNIKGEWEWLSVAQHFGLPTRIIDWTYSSYVALHFATNELSKIEEDGAVWCIHIDRANEHLPPSLRKLLAAERCRVFTIKMLENKFDNTRQWAEEEGQREFVLFFEPPSLDARIVNQVALFAMMSDATLRLDTWVQQFPGICKKIIVPASLKKVYCTGSEPSRSRRRSSPRR